MSQGENRIMLVKAAALQTAFVISPKAYEYPWATTTSLLSGRITVAVRDDILVVMLCHVSYQNTCVVNTAECS